MTGTDMVYQTSTTEMHKKDSKRTLKDLQKKMYKTDIYAQSAFLKRMSKSLT